MCSCRWNCSNYFNWSTGILFSFSLALAFTGTKLCVVVINLMNSSLSIWLNFNLFGSFFCKCVIEFRMEIRAYIFIYKMWYSILNISIFIIGIWVFLITKLLAKPSKLKLNFHYFSFNYANFGQMVVVRWFGFSDYRKIYRKLCLFCFFSVGYLNEREQRKKNQEFNTLFHR